MTKPDALRPNKVNHPIFYGCYDWHSSVHGHWLMAAMARRFPNDANLTVRVEKVFDQQFIEEKVTQELAFFATESQKNYERTYGKNFIGNLKLPTFTPIILQAGFGY